MVPPSQTLGDATNEIDSDQWLNWVKTMIWTCNFPTIIPSLVMYNVDVNVAMAKWCNMKNVFYDFNKNNVMPATRNMDIDGGWLIHKRGGFLGVSKRGPSGKWFMGINSNPYLWILLSFGETFYFCLNVWEPNY
jgi:hypothetical protein